MEVGTCQGAGGDSKLDPSEYSKVKETAEAEEDIITIEDSPNELKVKSEFNDVTDVCSTTLPLFEIQGPSLTDE